MHTRRASAVVFRLGWWRYLVVLGLSILGVGLGSAAADPKGASGHECTEQNVAGAYGFVGSGTALQNPAGLPEGLVTTVGVQIFDGQGQWKTMNHTIIATEQPPIQVSLSGAYTVNPDCTFRLIDAEDRANDGVFVLDRQEGFFIETIQGVFLTFTMKRITKRGKED